MTDPYINYINTNGDSLYDALKRKRIIHRWRMKYATPYEKHHYEKENKFLDGIFIFNVIVETPKEMKVCEEIAIQQGRTIKESKAPGSGNPLYPQNMFFGNRLISGNRKFMCKQCIPENPEDIRFFSHTSIDGYQLRFKRFKEIFKDFLKKYCDYCGEDVEICNCDLEEIKKIENRNE